MHCYRAVEAGAVTEAVVVVAGFVGEHFVAAGAETAYLG